MKIKIGDKNLNFSQQEIKSQRVNIGGEIYYKISNFDGMRPFLMSIVSDSDHWMFISSNGALTAGRKNAEHALFPYYTDDKITESVETTGSKTLFLVLGEEEGTLWEPFSDKYKGVYELERNLYKGLLGDSLIYEEYNNTLGLRFRYGWFHSENYGFIKKSWLINESGSEQKMAILDGIQNIIPSGVGSPLQNQRSNLVNAYKKNELLEGANIGIYSLSSNIVDKPEPSEALRASLVWSTGLSDPAVLLCSRQLQAFREGKDLIHETNVRAEPGAYFVHKNLSLDKEPVSWIIGADVDKSVEALYRLEADLLKPGILERVEEDIELSRNELLRIVNMSDGIQVSSDDLSSARHVSNVLFNVMRGGIFPGAYQVDKTDLMDYVQIGCKEVFKRNKAFFDSLEDQLDLDVLLTKNKDINDVNLKRLIKDYLPLYFSRRHGDPSRPWNAFSIDTKKEDGSRLLNYEGNWRDIFQNWEALALSFPNFVESMISKFLNATTADGYNPYRITRSGIDWEIIEPDDPWSFIGYWGDHQIIYLLKLLELSENYHPGRLSGELNQKVYAFANVPYRIKPFEDLVKDPHDTIVFDMEAEHAIEKRVEARGSDGKLIWDDSGDVLHASLIEKLMIPLLAKVSNFVPEAGIWLNTQRPEWNDANNALVGYGVSMVTLSYLRRYVVFLKNLIEKDPIGDFEVSESVHEWISTLSRVLETNQGLLNGAINDKDRFSVLSGLGKAAERYNHRIYNGDFGGSNTLQQSNLVTFLDHIVDYCEHTIRANVREDGLYHAYNLIAINEDTCSIEYLYEMLEGQVAILSSKYLSTKESVEVLDAMKKSDLFRADQYSYILYPDRDLPQFKDRNVIPEEIIKSNQVLSELITKGDTNVVRKDEKGLYHFHPDCSNGNALESILDELSVSASDKSSILDIYERVFNHRAFTGRSGTFYGYEGLNSIYWHMVSKLMLAVMEQITVATEKGEDPGLIAQMIQHYFEIRAGIGLDKNPELYGAYPTDPYSHTPGNKGAQQPGMTGQVKEDIISRFGELGVIVENGEIRFSPFMLRRSEFLEETEEIKYFFNSGESGKLNIPSGCLFFSIAQTPVYYMLSEEEPRIEVEFEGSSQEIEGLSLGNEISSMIFSRDPKLRSIKVYLRPQLS